MVQGARPAAPRVVQLEEGQVVRVESREAESVEQPGQQQARRAHRPRVVVAEVAEVAERAEREGVAVMEADSDQLSAALQARRLARPSAVQLVELSEVRLEARLGGLLTEAFDT